MAVVINEFEVVAEPPARARDSAAQVAESESEGDRKRIDAAEVREPLLQLHCAALRTWAH